MQNTSGLSQAEILKPVRGMVLDSDNLRLHICLDLITFLSATYQGFIPFQESRSPCNSTAEEAVTLSHCEVWELPLDERGAGC